MADTRTAVVDEYKQRTKETTLPVNRVVTSFDEPLRCMDGLLATYGAQASILVEDLNDKTQKVPAGTTEMFISAMSQMTRRSRAIRTMAFGEDMKNLSSYMVQSNSLAAFQPELIPTYTVRGSITQFDDNIAKKTADAGVTLGIASKNFLGFGGSKSTSINMLALDLTVVRSQDFSIVPGVNARNSAAILQEGTGVDGEAAVSKLGINYMTSFSKSDGKTVAVRNLVELSAIELMGKLNKVPYWKCLGVPSTQADVAAEIEDWNESMTGGEKLAFYIRHLTAMGLLADDGKPTDPEAFKTALREYFQALGLTYTGSFSLELMRAHFDADQNQILAKIEEARHPQWKLSLNLAPPNPSKPDVVGFQVAASLDSNVYCFLQDEAGTVARVYPNRWQKQSRIAAGQAIALPPPGQFEIKAHTSTPQSLQCFASQKNVDRNLGSSLGGADLTPITAVPNLASVRKVFATVAPDFVSTTIEFKGTGKSLVAEKREN
ncbi:DUF4384 domain-containing protein [Tahibacter amnicola]|uniref:DUF4384 domain-containing protein n=1 Tax=Tahibacter amnicola TaxID=2976241 RepID=A0ABY6BJE1_9GAMM|nr:DUF4384 domain-containing protein [Tahibacter amnicola]UXI68500.1 DUF4384 domain-containing protein [Tahibacter amnicola]